MIAKQSVFTVQMDNTNTFCVHEFLFNLLGSKPGSQNVS